VSLLFNEELYSLSKWTIDIPTSGFASTLSLFSYDLERVSQFNDESFEKTPSIHQIESFITKLFLKMKLTNEICLIALIFIERLMKKGRV
jgi:hypothetical protein